MKTVFSPDHARHAGQLELDAGVILPGFEKPERAMYVHDRAKAVGLGDIVAPTEHGLAPLTRIHTEDYVAFLGQAWDLWAADGNSGTALPMAWPTRGLRDDVPPRNIRGLLGYYSFDGGAGFVAGTYAAIRASADVALTGVDLIRAGERSAFALCRPPGHHAGTRFAGGYCYINNAAVAAQSFLDAGAKRVTILDVDYHHGNGTQEIFWSRSDVQFISLHADPLEAYPYLLGHRDEIGIGAGEGFNINYPMPVGTDWTVWGAALDDAAGKIAAYAPDVVIVSLGVDTFEKDPISQFRLKSDDYPKIGARIARLGLPTLFVMEGGYAVEEIGINAVGVMTGFEGR